MSISVDDKEGTIAIVSADNRVSLYNYESGECQPRSAVRDPKMLSRHNYCSHVQMISGKIYLTYPSTSQMRIFNKAGNREHTLFLYNIMFPWHVAKFNSRLLIISNAKGRVGRFPICPNSVPHWAVGIKGAGGVCVDHIGIVYVPVNTTKSIDLLSRKDKLLLVNSLDSTGRFLFGMHIC